MRKTSRMDGLDLSGFGGDSGGFADDIGSLSMMVSAGGWSEERLALEKVR